MTYQSKIIAGGKIVIPAELRRELGFADGDTLMVEREGNSVVLKSRAQVIAEVQESVRRQIKQPFTVDDYIAEKRAEAASE